MLFNGMFLHFWDFLASRYSVLLLFHNPLSTRAQEKQSSWAAWSPVDPSKHMTEEYLNHWVFPLKTQLGRTMFKQLSFFPPIYQPDDKNVYYTLQLVTSGDVSHLDVLIKESLKCRHCCSRAVPAPLTTTCTYLNAELLLLPCWTARWFHNTPSVLEVLAVCDLLDTDVIGLVEFAGHGLQFDCLVYVAQRPKLVLCC